MLIKYTCFEDFIFQYTGSKFSIWAWKRFSSYAIFRRRSWELTWTGKKSISMVSQAVEEWCKCGKCEAMLT